MTTTPSLSGIRVANFGWVYAGPVVGQTLGFLGAAEVYGERLVLDAAAIAALGGDFAISSTTLVASISSAHGLGCDLPSRRVRSRVRPE